MRSRDNVEKQLIASHHNLEAEDFWLEKLSGEIHKSCFPYDYDRKEHSAKGYNWDKVELKFNRELVAKLLSVSRQSDHALHIILAAGLVLLLAKYTYSYDSNKDIIIGSPIYRQEIEGEFVNTILPFRFQMKDTLSFKDLLQQAKQTVLEAVQNQNYPVELLIKQLNFSFTSISHQDFPLFDTVILLENIHDKKYIRHINLNTIFSFSRTGESITGVLKYNALRYERTTIEQIAAHLTVLLKKALFNANLELSEIEMLTVSERKQILDEFNNTEAEYPGDKTLDELFEEQVERTPDRAAVLGPVVGTDGNEGRIQEDDMQYVSYRELKKKSNQLARALRDKGIKAGTIVPIIVERSIEMAIGIMAILKAGGAYLPIEPEYPRERIVYMLTDSNAKILLSKVSEVSEVSKDIEVIDLTQATQPIPPTHPTHPTHPPHPTQLCYVIYTSGTTGKPKGVLVEHRSVVNYIHWRLKSYGFTASDVTLQLLSYAFDGFGCNFYSSLFSGGVLVMIPGSKKMDFDYIKKIVKESGVTNMSLVPGIYEALLQRSEADDLKSLRFVLLGGEKAGANLLKRSKDKNPGIQHIIEYGPTEATIGATANIEVSPEETSIIGRPIANTSIFILDHSHLPQPKGVPGELYIAGAGVARGYLNNPEPAAEKFINLNHSPTHPLTHSPIYKTGDLACWLHNGNIEFLGRIDQQVKIRGFRVELEEIENHLRQHKEIDECIVITTEGNENNQLELIAFYKYKKKNNIIMTSKEIREFLAKKLPDYMIPSHLIELEEFSLTTNGKIDRKMLVLPEKFDIEIEVIKPRNEIEQRISVVWQEVIGIEEIGIHNGFFDIGGTSIKALTVVSHLSSEFDITIDHIYQHRTIANIAENVTWRKDSLKIKIENIKNILKEGVEVKPEAIKVLKVQRKQLNKDYKAYMKEIKKEKLPLLAAEQDYGHILLTGGTGFLGAHLIYEMLAVTDAELHLLVRGDSPREAEEHLKTRLDFYFGEKFFDINKKRLHLVHGDIRADKLGIDESLYEKLSETVDAVVHSAADVRHFGMYEDFYKVNVQGTENLLELAERKKKKDFHHISTLSVGSGSIEDKRTIVFTEFCHDVGQKNDNVYIKTKLESEKKVLSYREKGINSSIYRVGNLISHSETGKFQENIEGDAFYAELKATITMGMVPNLKGMFLEMSFIDHMAAACVRLMTRKNLQNETYHLKNIHIVTWPEMVSLLNKSGVDIEVVETEQFLDYLLECIEDDKNMDVIARLLLHVGLFGEMTEDIATHTAFRTVTDRTLRILKQLGFEWVKPNESHVGKMIEHCRQVGFLP